MTSRCTRAAATELAIDEMRLNLNGYKLNCKDE